MAASDIEDVRCQKDQTMLAIGQFSSFGAAVKNEDRESKYVWLRGHPEEFTGKKLYRKIGFVEDFGIVRFMMVESERPILLRVKA